MNRLHLTPRRVLAAVVVALVISSLLPAGAARSIADKPRDVVQAVTRPLVGLLAGLGGALQGEVGPGLEDRDPEQIDELYGQAQVTIARLTQQLHEAHDVIEQLSGAREAFRLSGVRFLTAGVVDASIGPSRQTLVIGRGRRHGVAVGQAVVAGVNLVGLVVDTTPATATVRLISAAGTVLQVNIAPPGPQAPPRQVQALIRLEESGRRFAVPMGKHKGVSVGDVARLTDDQYPPEAHFFVVGSVAHVRDDADDPLMYSWVVIEPAAPLHHLRHVIVLVPADQQEPEP